MLSAAVSSDFPTSPFLAKFRIVDQPQGRFIPTKKRNRRSGDAARPSGFI